jgi:Flp pilus assembly protein TadG
MPVEVQIMRSRCTSKERGSNILESALVLLVFLLILIGSLDFGQFLYLHQSLVERARAAARYGSVNPTATDAIKNVAVYNLASPPNTATPMVPNMTTTMVTVQNLDANSTSARVVVTISNYPMRFLSPYIAGAFTNRSITASMIAESQVP